MGARVETSRFRQVPGDGDAVLGAGLVDQLPTQAVRDRRLPCWNLVLVLSGNGWFAPAGGAQVPLAPGDLLLTCPGQRHGYGALGASWCTMWVWFRGPLFVGLQRLGLLDPRRPVWHPGLDPVLVAGLHGLLADILASDLPDEQWLAAQVHALVARAHGLAARHGRSAEPRVVAAARTALERGAALAPVARAHGISADRLRRLFRAAVGVSPGRWRVMRRLDRAKQRLAAGDAVAAVALELGYADHRLFGRQFRAVTGMTPSAFRLAARGAAG